MAKGAVLMIFSMVSLFGIQDSASTARPLPHNPHSSLSYGRLREHFPRLFSLLVAGNTQHTQLNMKHGINSMACDLYAKCHMLHLHETEQETGLFFFFTMSSCHK